MQRYPNRTNKAITEEQFLQAMDGYYVLDLIPRNDGLPWYSGHGLGYAERFSFRGQFLRDCESIIGTETLEKCYHSCLTPGLATLGHELRAKVTAFSTREELARVEKVGQPIFDPAS